MIDRRVVRDLEDPRRELELGPVRFDAVQDLDERFLREVLGERAIAHHPIEQRKHRTFIAAHELAKCRVMSLLCPRDDLLIAGVAQVVRPIFRAYESLDRKSTRLNSSHPSISYAVFCLKKKNKPTSSTVSRTTP